MPWTPQTARQLAKRVRRLRIQQGMSQEVLAQHTKVSKNHIQVIEAAARLEPPREVNLRLSTLYRLADALGVEPCDLLHK